MKDMHSDLQNDTDTDTDTHACTHRHTQTRTQTHTCIHVHTHVHTHVHAQAVWTWHLAPYGDVALFAPWDGPLADLAADVDRRWWSLEKRRTCAEEGNSRAGQDAFMDTLLAMHSDEKDGDDSSDHALPAHLDVLVRNHAHHAVVFVAHADAALVRAADRRHSLRARSDEYLQPPPARTPPDLDESVAVARQPQAKAN